MSTWERVGHVAPRELTDARLQLHWAAQIPAAFGARFVPSSPDDSHTALVADVERSVLTSGASDSRRVALSVPELRIVVLDDRSHEPIVKSLEGATLEQARHWLETKLGASGLELPSYDMPAHPVHDGARFRVESPPAFLELSFWFNNAARVLRGLDLGEDRCWPHHFDLAVLKRLGNDTSVGVGMSPGDGSYDEPYWYVAPWPHPTVDELPELGQGRWHTEGFVAAVLTGSDIVADADPARQRNKLEAFIDEAVSVSKALLSRG